MKIWGGEFRYPIFSAYVRTTIFPCWFFVKLHPRNLVSDWISKRCFCLLWSIMLIVKTFEENITFCTQNHRFFHLRAYLFILLFFCSAYGRTSIISKQQIFSHLNSLSFLLVIFAVWKWLKGLSIWYLYVRGIYKAPSRKVGILEKISSWKCNALSRTKKSVAGSQSRTDSSMCKTILLP